MTAGGNNPDQAEQAAPHVPVMFTANALPGPMGNVPTQIAQNDIATLKQHAIDLFNFLEDPNAQLTQLNVDNTPRLAIINIPESSKVKVVYCFGIGASPIGVSSNIDGKFVSLTGDGGNDVGSPQPLVLPASIRTRQNVSTMTHDHFCQTITAKGANYTWPLKSRDINNQSSIMQIAPIPAHLIFDGFQTDLDAAEVYERVLTVTEDDASRPMYTHLREFLRASLGRHNTNDNKPYLPTHIIMSAPSMQARQWANTKFASCFPTLQPQRDTPPGQQIDFAAMFAQYHAQANANRNNGGHAEEKKEDNPLGVVNEELLDLLTMCGQPRTGTHTDLPQWFQLCAKKGKESFKLTIIKRQITNEFFYDDAKVPLTAPLVKMALKHNWSGKEGNFSRPSLANAAEGLSPFAVLELTEDEVANINAKYDALDTASSVTVTDIAAAKHSLKAYVPETSEGFITLLKRFANLLFALFTGDCPLFNCVANIIDCIRDFSDAAKKAMSKASKASILWIIFLQSRQFSIGEFDILAEFTAMQAALRAKQPIIRHAEVPDELWMDKKRKGEDLLATGKDDKKAKPTPDGSGNGGKNANNWHPTLKAKLGPALAAAGNPTLSQVLKYCDKADGRDIFPNSTRICIPNSFLGTCGYKSNCSKKHVLPSNTEVEEILKMTSKFIQNPEGAKQG